ncbi:MAG: hypothetical protein JWM27_3064, partial [Gemmatimonadetes bacterium]|nr:hypothetical protein [Gemmatimonadota bacterium]
MRRRPILIALSALLLAAAPLAAQTVTGTLTDPSTGAGVRGATVVLLEPSGREASTAVTTASGAFSLHAAHGGRFTLRADRIGFHATTTPPFELAVGQTVRRALEASTQHVGLEALTVTSRTRCHVRAGGADGTAAVWEEARKALAIARATSRQHVYRFSLRRYRRQLDPRTEAVQAELAHPVSGWSGDPFVAAAPRVLADSGYVNLGADTLVYYAPDAAALLSDEFQDGHCFRLQAAPPGHPGWIGVAFEPVRARAGIADVSGVVWVDRQTSELQTLDFHYTGLPGGRRVDDASHGGIEFRRLPAGSWIVTRWRIRMPRVEMTHLHPGGGFLLDADRAALAGLIEEGGEVAAVTLPNGMPVPVHAGAVLAGTVFDSTRSAPLAGARVSLRGTDYAAAADSAGRFALRDVPDGTYEVTFAAPRLDSLHWAPPPVRVTLSAAAAARAELAVPRLARVLAA